MNTKVRHCLLAAAILACSLGDCLSRAAADDLPPYLNAFEKGTSRLLERLDSLRRRFSKELATVEKAREEARNLERAHPSPEEGRLWKAKWGSVAEIRAALHVQHKAQMRSWERALGTVIKLDRRQPFEKKARNQIAGMCLAVLGSWLQGAEPGSVFDDLAREHSSLASALRWNDSAPKRRSLLSLVAGRLASTPGNSDLNVLCEVVRWDALFLKGLGPGKSELSAVSIDLVLLFTERSADGLTKSNSSFYQPNRFSDRGFKAPLRDGSDQVRHFSWAFRMFARSRDLDATEQLLGIKERRDAADRKQALNKADLALNGEARRLVEQILGIQAGAKRKAKQSTPIPVEWYSGGFRQALGS